MRAPVLMAAGIGLATVALHLRDPSEETWTVCPMAMLGYWCPGCGGLRAVNHLSNLRLTEAASSNLLFVASIPFLVAGWAWWARRAWQGRTPRLPARVAVPLAVVALVLMVAFTVTRNLGAGAWLAP